MVGFGRRIAGGQGAAGHDPARAGRRLGALLADCSLLAAVRGAGRNGRRDQENGRGSRQVLRDLVIRASPNWSVHPLLCTDVLVRASHCQHCPSAAPLSRLCCQQCVWKQRAATGSGFGGLASCFDAKWEGVFRLRFLRVATWQAERLTIESGQFDSDKQYQGHNVDGFDPDRSLQPL